MSDELSNILLEDEAQEKPVPVPTRPDFIQAMQVYSDKSGVSPVSPITMWNSFKRMLTGVESQKLKLEEKYDYSLRHERFQKNLQREKKYNWTDDTPGFVNKNGDFSTSVKAGPGIIYETTWGEAKSKMQKTLVANQKEFGKDLMDIMNKRAIEGAYEKASFVDFASGENSLKNLSLMASEQIPNMFGAIISFGMIPALSEGAGVYETLLVNAAIERFNLSPGQQPTAEQMYTILMEDTDNKIANTATVTQPFIAGLEAYQAPFPVSMIRGAIVAKPTPVYTESIKDLKRSSKILSSGLPAI